MGYAVLNFISKLIFLYASLFIVRAVLDVLVHFGVIRTHHPLFARFRLLLFQLTEPVLRPIRKLMPKSLELDISPLVVVLALYFIRDVVKGMAWM